MTHYDTQTNPGVARAQMQKAIDGDPYVILGPVFSGYVMVTMALAKQAEIPDIIGGEAGELTSAGRPLHVPHLVRPAVLHAEDRQLHARRLKAKKIAVIWVNNDFGKGGRETFIKEMKARNIKIVADISTESGQVDFAADVVKVKGANADAVFVYTNEEESARFLREARKQGLKVPLIGETTLLSQKVIELAGDAANGVQGPCRPDGRRADPGDRGIRRASSRSASSTSPTTTASRAIPAVYAIKYVTEKKSASSTARRWRKRCTA